MSFIWRVSSQGYRWNGPADARSLVAISGDSGVREYSPLLECPGLYLAFANTLPAEEDILAFANRYGILGVQSEHLSTWSTQIRAMREVIEQWGQLCQAVLTAEAAERLYVIVNDHLLASWANSSNAKHRQQGQSRNMLDKYLDRATSLRLPLMEMIAAASRGKGNWELEIRGANLLNALWLQLAFAIGRDAQFRQCTSCGSWFEVSPESRRADAQYCREACRVSAYKGRRREARRLHAAGTSLREIARNLGTTAKVVRGWIGDGHPTQSSNKGE